MVLTLELPIRPRAFNSFNPYNAFAAYEQRFGALPAWFDEIAPIRAQQLAAQALRAGVPLCNANYFN